jgi:hypothetical protein
MPTARSRDARSTTTKAVAAASYVTQATRFAATCGLSRAATTAASTERPPRSTSSSPRRPLSWEVGLPRKRGRRGYTGDVAACVRRHRAVPGRVTMHAAMVAAGRAPTPNNRSGHLRGAARGPRTARCRRAARDRAVSVHDQRVVHVGMVRGYVRRATARFCEALRNEAPMGCQGVFRRCWQTSDGPLG